MQNVQSSEKLIVPKIISSAEIFRFSDFEYFGEFEMFLNLISVISGLTYMKFTYKFFICSQRETKLIVKPA